MALTPRLNLENCHLADERNKLTGAIWGAHNTFSQAYRSVKYGTPSAYSPWFGVKDSSRKDRVRRNFRRARDYVSLYAYKCGCSTTQERDRDAGGLYNGNPVPFHSQTATWLLISLDQILGRAAG